MRTLTRHTDHAEFDITLEAECGLAVNATLVASYTYHPASRGATDGPGGPPIEPDTAASVELGPVSMRLRGPDGKGFFMVPLKDTDYDGAELARACLSRAEAD